MEDHKERKEWLAKRTEWLLSKTYDCADIILTQYEDYAIGQLPPLKIKQLESIAGWRWMTREECYAMRREHLYYDCPIPSIRRKELTKARKKLSI